MTENWDWGTVAESLEQIRGGKTAIALTLEEEEQHEGFCGPFRGFRVCYCRCPRCRKDGKCVCEGCWAGPKCLRTIKEREEQR